MNNNYINNSPKKEEKRINIVPILLIIIVLAAFTGGGYYLYKNKDKFEITDIIPWIDENKTESKKDSSNTNNNSSNLSIPTLGIVHSSAKDGNINITGVTADDKGYLITLELQCSQVSWCSISVTEILIDGFYVSTTFDIEDDGTDTEATQVQFRINQTELDNLEITGFQNIIMYYYYDSPTLEEKDKGTLMNSSFTFYNKIPVDNTKKGLLNVDTKGTVTIKYYKIVKSADYTYIYFDVKNSNSKSTQTIMIKKLLINGDIYEMTEFEEKIYNGAEQLVYIKIPTQKVKEVKNITVSFFILEKDKNNENTKIYITNEFNKKF